VVSTDQSDPVGVTNLYEGKWRELLSWHPDETANTTLYL
jgi:hypothetical protein